MAIINDSDLLVVQHSNGNNYKYTGAQLKADINELGGSTAGVTKINAGSNVSISPTSGVGEVTISASGGSNPPTPTLAQVCAQGSNTGAGQGMFVQGNFNVQVNGVDTGINQFGISTEGDIGCNGTSSAGAFAGPGGFVVDSSGGLYNPGALNAPGEGNSRDLIIRGSGDRNVGLLCTRNARSLPEVQAATPLNTDQFLNVLNNVEIIRYEDGEVSVRPDTLYQNEQARFLHFDGEDAEYDLNYRNIPPYLVAVCKQQQALIENLTTRIEQLEADHASAMNNMEDENGSSAY